MTPLRAIIIEVSPSSGRAGRFIARKTVGARVPGTFFVIAADGNPSGVALRALFVRGHLRRRKSGLFWWFAYQRGDPRLGFVHKDYSVQLPTQERAA